MGEHLSKPTFNLNISSFKRLLLVIENVGIIRDDNGDDWNLCLASKVKCAGLERKKHWLRRVRPGALREDPDALLHGLHIRSGRVERGNGALAVRPVDENGLA